MSRVRIEWVPITDFGLGLFGFDHLRLTFQPSGSTTYDDQVNWFVLEGTRTTTSSPYSLLTVTGFDGTTTLGEVHSVVDNGVVRLPTPEELESQIGTPEDRGSRVLPFYDAFSAWNAMTQFGADIQQQGLPYIAIGLPFTALPTINSTSVIASLLHHAGLDPSANMPFGMRLSPGATTLIGTTNDDDLEITNGFKNIVAGKGSDLLKGTNDTSATESFYGGEHDDGFVWSKGFNIFHGGQPNLSYASDGTDTLIYDGVGELLIERGSNPIPHYLPDFIATHDGGLDWLLSIDRLEWKEASDIVRLGEGVAVSPDGMKFNFGGEQTSGADKGDQLDLALETDGLLFNTGASDTLYISSKNETDDTKGLWVEDLEWLVATSGDDKIYLADTMRGIEGGEGDDLIDARLVTAGTGHSPQGYDIEITGGDGEDTIVAGPGHVLANGGNDADTYVLSHITGQPGTNGTVEFVIADVSAADRLYVPYNFFNDSGAGFDGSELFPILGAIGSYGDLMAGDRLAFDWLTVDDYFALTETYTQTDFTSGVIDFQGAIEYTLDATDLLIHVFMGEKSVETIEVAQGQSETFTFNNVLASTETIIRVQDYQPGDLGLTFFDPGPAMLEVTFPNGDPKTIFLGQDPGIATITNNGTFAPALELKPEAPSADPNDPANNPPPDSIDGTGGNDVIIAVTNGDTTILAGAGDDTVTGKDGNDVLDGGTGDDTLAGAGGDDTYIIDSENDVITEVAGAGIDTAISSVSATLPGHVENLTLTGGAISATGNDLGNQLVGNGNDNLLTGGAGDDTLFGGAGNNTLIGGDGNDAYIYAPGDGDDIIRDTGPATDVDTLVLTGRYTPADLTFHRPGAASNDLIVQVPTGGRIVLEDYFSASHIGPDKFRFDSGLVWDRADIDAAAAAATVSLNDPPQAVADSNLVLRGNTTTIPAAALLQNDRDFNGDPLSIQSIANVSIGTATLDPSGDITLTLPAGYEGILTFDYTITDGAGGTSSANAEIVVIPENYAPTAVDDTGFDVTAGASTVITPAQLLANDYDEEAHELAITSVQNAVNGTVARDPQSGNITVSAAAGATGNVSFDYTIVDTGGATATASVTALITAVINGTGGADQLDGTEGNDIISGLGGNDTISALGGNDQVFAGNGDDNVTGGDGNDSLFGESGIDTLNGGDGDDILDGGKSGDTLNGDAGADTIAGGDGNDTLNGGTGNDTLNGQSGSDILNGGNGDDILDGGKSGDQLFGDAGADTLNGGDGSDVLHGGLDDDTLNGDASNDTLNGGDGNDLLSGGGGYDTLNGDAGNDTLDGDAGNDTLNGGDGNDTLFGGSGTDQLNGGAGDDILDGESGSDTLKGGGGDDTLTGGLDKDTFVFDLNFGHDTITDFDLGTVAEPVADKLDVSALGYASLAAVLANAAQDGADTLITHDATSSIRLTGIDMTSLQADDFQF